MSTGQQVQAVSLVNLQQLAAQNTLFQSILTRMIGQPTIQFGSATYITVSQILAASPQTVNVPNQVIQLIPSPVNCCINPNANVVATTTFPTTQTIVTASTPVTPITQVAFPTDDLTFLQFARPGIFGTF